MIQFFKTNYAEGILFVFDLFGVKCTDVRQKNIVFCDIAELQKKYVNERGGIKNGRNTRSV